MGLIAPGAGGGGPIRFLSSGSAPHIINNHMLRNHFGCRFGVYTWMHYKSGIPAGTRPQGAYIMPFDAGGISMQVRSVASTVALSIKGIGQIALAVNGTSSFVCNLRDGRRVQLSVTGTGNVAFAARSIGLMKLIINVSALTQDDVVSGILDAKIDGVKSLKDYIKLIGSAAAGKIFIAPSGPNLTVSIRNLNDTEDAITGTTNPSKERINVSYNFGD